MQSSNLARWRASPSLPPSLHLLMNTGDRVRGGTADKEEYCCPKMAALGICLRNSFQPILFPECIPGRVWRSCWRKRDVKV